MDRRNFLKLIRNGTLVAIAGANGINCSGMRTDPNSEQIADQELSRRIAILTHKHQLKQLDTHIGQESKLEQIFQREFNNWPDTNLKVRSAPGAAQLDYNQILNSINASGNTPVSMLYPGGGDDITPILMFHLMNQVSGNAVGLRAVYTEIDDLMPEQMKQQLELLKTEGALDFKSETEKKPELKIQKFQIQTPTGEFEIEYHIRKPSDHFFTPEEAAAANLFRDNYSTGSGYFQVDLIAPMILQGYSPNKPIVIMTPDYDDLGDYYTYSTTEYGSLVLPDRLITKEELMELEKTKGPRQLSYQAKKKNLPITELPSDVNLSRGYVGCSCDGCQYELKTKEREPQKSKYTLLLQPQNIEGINEDDLSTALWSAFKTQPEVYICIEGK
ncbi:hypothetical protein HN587_02255 [Candidatus Woesearchaeota archaeon]|jgi:hypothetical protein|nr:hypothetical protein [Candidatus Woesearchaeota archaeon]